MTDSVQRDSIDLVIDDVNTLWPTLQAEGLPIVGRVLTLARYFEADRERQLAPFGLTLGDFDVLATLRRRSPASGLKIGDVQGSLMMSSGGMTKRLDRLEQAGLLERQPDPDDRRGVLVRLTADGRRLIDKALRVITAHESEVVQQSLRSKRARSEVVAGLRQLLHDHESTEQ